MDYAEFVANVLSDSPAPQPKTEKNSRGHYGGFCAYRGG